MSKYQCTKCDKSYSWKCDLVKHFKVKHLHTLKYICDICNKIYSSDSSLKRHIDSVHNNIKYSCTQCDKVYCRKSSLTLHINIKHDKQFKRYRCKSCEKIYTRKSHLKTHINTDHNPDFKGYKCKLCDMKYTQKENLYNHVNIKHNSSFKGYKCGLCATTCTRKNGLKIHIEQIHDIGTHKCDFCLGNRNSHILYKDTVGKHSICRKCYNKATGKSTRVEHTWSDYLDKHIGAKYLTSSDKSLISQGGCQRYRPDKLYVGLDLVEIDECDEHQHKWNNGSYECDEKRISDIYEEKGICGKTLVVIRWNPDYYKDPNGNKKLKREDRLQLHIKLKKYLRENQPEDKITIYYMFYDIDSDRISKNYPFKMIYCEDDINDI